MAEFALGIVIAVLQPLQITLNHTLKQTNNNEKDHFKICKKILLKNFFLWKGENSLIFANEILSDHGKFAALLSSLIHPQNAVTMLQMICPSPGLFFASPLAHGLP